jgi:integrase
MVDLWKMTGNTKVKIMLTIKAEIQKEKLRQDGTYNVKIRFTKGKQVKRISTDLFVNQEELTSTLKFKEGSSIQQETDRLVLHYRTLFSDLRIDSNDYSLDEIVNFLLNKDKINERIDFIQFAKSWIEQSHIKGKNNYATTINSIIRYNGKDELDMKFINSEYVNKYKEYLIQEKEKREKIMIASGKRVASNRTLSLYLMSFRHLFNEAKKFYNNEEQGLIRISNNPFEYVTIPRQEATRKRAIAPEKIKQIWELSYQNIYKGARHTNRFNLAKDCFIISFCLIGINSADLYNATEYDGERLTYYRKKTKDRRLDDAKMIIDVPLFIKKLIDKYRDKTEKRVFNFYQYYRDEKAFNKAINKGLKQIGDIIGVDDLEYYAARHSWATIAINRIDIDKYTVHTALNHIDESMRVTDIYIERDFVNENKANKRVIKYVFNK